MTMQTIPVIQPGLEITLPLSKLKTSPRNARKTRHSPADIDALAASIAAKGVLQPPVVEPERNAAGDTTGKYLVTIGEGRRLALCALVKRKLLRKDVPVRCLLDTTNDAFEISLDENVTRFAMHSADQFEAFRDLAESRGLSAEEIAVRFGVSAHVVRQRLALATVSPALIAVYRKGELTLEQMMAFAVTGDHERQEQVHAALSYNRSPTAIRRALTETEVEATERRAVYVGAEAYQAAGGRIRRDLFSEDQGGWFEDAALLDRLVLERLQVLADGFVVDGWRWAEVHIDFPHSHGLGRIYPVNQEPNEETAAVITALSDEQDALIALCEEGALDPDEAQLRSDDIETRIAELTAPRYTAEMQARSGVFVSLSWEGAVRIDRGLIRDEDQASDNDRNSDQATANTTKGPKPLPERLVQDLTAHRTAALRDRLANDPEAAHLALLHALVLKAFYPGREASCLQIKFVSTALGGFAGGYDDSRAGQSIGGRHERWAARLPQQSGELWCALTCLPVGERSELLAHCISMSVDAIQGPGRYVPALVHADQLARHLALDMTDYWQATVASYFGQITKDRILEAVSEGSSAEAAANLVGLKKDAMASAAADLLGADGWLPPLLRTAAAGPA